jgi:predicted TIM-barrel fold metal-dependent hydrolase
MPRAIDTWVNVSMGSEERPEWLVRVAEDYFHRADEMFRDLSFEELTETMDRAGVEKCIITTQAERPSPHALSFSRRDPARFALSVVLDPRRGMDALRALERMVRDEPVVLARITPFMVGAIPPNEKEYYPVYAKCIELDLPIAINTGIPGPPMPGKCQDPMHLDEVCVFFPELKLVMAHGADPWWDVAIRLMIKYRNLYLQTSAYAPRYFPPQLIHFMNTRGQDKIIFATDHPVLSFERCVKEAEALDLREGVLDKFLYANAERLFFSGRAAPAPAVTAAAP